MRFGRNVWVAYEDHYKDYFWERPDFSQRGEIFLEIVNRLRDTSFKINFDFGNPVMIGEDSIALLRPVVDRVVNVHCSDRFQGEYPHQIAGKGSVNFPAGFRILHEAGYDGWLSSEYNGNQGLEGLKQLPRLHPGNLEVRSRRDNKSAFPSLKKAVGARCIVLLLFVNQKRSAVITAPLIPDFRIRIQF